LEGILEALLFMDELLFGFGIIGGRFAPTEHGRINIDGGGAVSVAGFS